MDAMVNSLVGVGLYSAAEAAALTSVPEPSIRRWLKGYRYRRGQTVHDLPPVWKRDIETVDGHLAVTFLDMMEARFVHTFRRHHVSWQFIREAVHIACDMFEDSHPFTRGRFRTDGQRIFRQIEDSGRVKLFDMNRRSWVFNDIVAPSLFQDVELSDDQVARWYPLHPNHSIVVDPRIAFGRPTLANEGIPADIIAAAVTAHDGDVAAVSHWYRVPVRSVKAAYKFEQKFRRQRAA